MTAYTTAKSFGQAWLTRPTYPRPAAPKPRPRAGANRACQAGERHRPLVERLEVRANY